MKKHKPMNLFFLQTTSHSQPKKGETFGNDINLEINVGEIIPYIIYGIPHEQYHFCLQFV